MTTTTKQQLTNVLIQWYNEKKIDEIFDLMKKYDNINKSTINSIIGLGKSKTKRQEESNFSFDEEGNNIII